MSFSFLTAFWLFFAPAVSDSLDDQLKKFLDLLTVVQAENAEPVDGAKAFHEGAIPGMLKRLDPHSVFFDPGQFQQLQEMQRSTSKGFGTVVSLLPGRVIVLQTMPGTPSAKSGISPGDEIIGINGIPLNRLEVEQLVQLLSESRQQKVGLDVRRPGNARVLQFVLTPEEVDSPSVDRAFLLKPDIGFIRVASFDNDTGKLIKAAIEKLGGNKLKGLVLDLRNNPGGLLPAALETAGLFLKPGQRILTIKGRAKKDDEADVKPDAVPYVFPLAVLVNGKSASASEIVAGAMQDHDRATIIGEPSYGKGIVQSVFPLSHGTGLALTTAFYYTPSGRSIQKHLAGALNEATATDRAENLIIYHTDAGRVVKGGGGIQPDQIVHPDGATPLRVVLETTGVFPTFATSYVRRHADIQGDFEAPSSALDELQVLLSQNNIRPSVSEWSQERDWIRNRLTQEILNQALGVAKGDEVEAKMDPQVKAGLKAIGAL